MKKDEHDLKQPLLSEYKDHEMKQKYQVEKPRKSMPCQRDRFPSMDQIDRV